MKKQALFVILFFALVASACNGQASPAAAQPEVAAPEVEMPEAAPVEAAPVEAAPVEAAPAVQQPAEQSADTSSMAEYVAPEDLFTLRIPAGWSIQKDTTTIENTLVETATSPDGNAFVQMMTNRVGNSLNNVLKGQVTLDYMKRLYGKDMRVASDVTLKDGREKLEWWSEENKTSGTTYFDMEQKYLYYFTVGYKDKFEKDYASILKEVADSFSK